jgi:OFA family oxalate/formate antiporter-like MFS transporter
MELEKKRWVYMVMCTIINVVLGQTYAWSVFAKPISEQFGWGPVDVALAFTIFHSIAVIPIIVGGKVQDYIEPKYVILIGGLVYGLSMLAMGYIQTLTHLYLAYGVFGGISMGFTYAGTVPNIVRFFPDRRGLASGVLAAGVGSGALIWAPVAAKLIESNGVLGAYKILGIIYLIVLVGLALLVKTAPEGYKPAGWKPSADLQKTLAIPDKNWKEMLADPLFYCLACMFVMGTIAGLMIIAHASPILQSVGGLTPVVAGSWVGILAVANSGGRVGWGFISDRIGRLPSMIIIYILCGLGMLSLATIAKSDTLALLIFSILLVGSCFGGFMGMLASTTADAFGPKYLPVNFGVMFFAFGVAAFIGPRLAATIKQANNGDYSKAFLIASALSLVGIALAFLANKLLQKKRRDAEAASGAAMAQPAA